MEKDPLRSVDVQQRLKLRVEEKHLKNSLHLQPSIKSHKRNLKQCSRSSFSNSNIPSSTPDEIDSTTHTNGLPEGEA